MGTYETDEFEYSFCPCGAGSIIKRVHSPDNPWSRVFVDFRISCKTCDSEFYVSDSVLESKVERNVYNSIGVHLRETIIKIEAIAAPLIDSFYETRTFKSMAEQHRDMESKTLHPVNIRDFRKGIKSFRKPSQLCHIYDAKEFILSLIKRPDIAIEVDGLFSIIDKLKDDEKAAYLSIKRVSILSLPTKSG